MTSPAKQLATAIAIASEAHKDQVDKGGAPYILHPLRVMQSLAYTGDYELMAAAVLHDVLEDTNVDNQYLIDSGISINVRVMVEILTREDNESYEQFINQVSRHKDTTLIKMADIKDNSDVTRLKGLRQRDMDRLSKYAKAYTKLKESLNG